MRAAATKSTAADTEGFVEDSAVRALRAVRACLITSNCVATEGIFQLLSPKVVCAPATSAQQGDYKPAWNMFTSAPES